MLLQSFIAAAEPHADPDLYAPSQRLRDKLAEISHDRTPEQARAEIAAWKQREPNSATPYIVSALYEWSLSRQPTMIYSFETHGIPRFPTREGKQLSIIDSRTGKEVAVVGEAPTGPKPDAETARNQQLKAAAELEEALKKFPDRFDLMIARSIALSEIEAWEPFARQMESALQRAATEPEKLRWLEDAKPPMEPGEELLSGLQSCIQSAFKQADAAGIERAQRFAQLGLKYFPHDARLLCDMGNFYTMANDLSRALACYEEARKSAPEDSIVLINLAQAYHRLGREE